VSESSNCQQCGVALESDSHAGLCPRCLVQVGIALQPAERLTAEQSSSAAADAAEGLPRRFGDYELLERIARGGMGVVYKARQVSLNRIVALKMILAGELATRQMVLRFRAEAEAAANLHHPNIVAIYETGELDGQHYFSMEHVDGADLGRIAAKGPLPAQRAASYLEKVALAVEYAHQHGLLHRDLKPSNVLIDEADQPRVTDFGLAKKFTADSDLTMSGQLLGSPNFMPPEQASSKRGKVGRHSDVYGLGALLYHLLTGRPPFQAASLEEALQQVFEKDPVSPRALNPGVPRDLETICLKCLEKESSRRYATAQAVAVELGRFLRGEPIQARPVSAPERLWRWCRRNPGLATLGAAVNLLLVALAIGGLTVAHREREAAAKFQSLAETYRVLLYASELKAAQQAIEEGNMQNAVTFLNRHIPEAGQEDLREFTWHYLNHLCQPYLATPELSHTSFVFYLAAPRDGKRLVVGGATDWVGIWDVATRSKTREFRTGEPWLTGPLACSPDGRYVVATGLRPERTTNGMQIWDSTVLRANPPWIPVYTRPGFFGAYSDFSPDGSLLAVPSANEIVLMEVGGNWEEIGRLIGHTRWVWSARFSPDGRKLVTASEDATARVWDVTTRQCLGDFTNHTAGLHAAAFSPDGRQVASASYDKTVRLWDADSMEEWRHYEHKVGLNALDFSADRWLIASGGTDGSVKVWDVEADTIRTLRGHSQYVMAVKFVLGGTQLASGSWDQTVKLWNLDQPLPNDLLEGAARYRSPLAFSGNGRWLATVSSNASEILLWDAATGRPATAQAGVLTNRLGRIADTRTLLSAEEAAAGEVAASSIVVTDLAFSPDDRCLAAARAFTVILPDSESARSRIEFWDIRRGAMLNSFEGWMPVRFSPVGGLLACVGTETDPGTILIREIATGRSWIADQTIPTGERLDLAFSPDAQTLVSSGMITFLWEAASGKWLGTLSEFTNSTITTINALAFTPDGQWLVTGGASAEIHLCEMSSRRRITTLRGHVPRVTGLAVSPDGRTLASADANGLIKLWSLRRVNGSAATGWDIRELLTLRGHEGSVESLQFSPDGSALASSSTDGTVRLWRAETEAAEKGEVSP
jgi:eukaryotic-like serine/threonine-protein kinase